MRIVHIITRLIIGGAQENTLLSCEGQHDHGHDVTLITGPPLGPEGSLLDRARSYGYRVDVLDAMHRSIRPAHDWQTFHLLTQRLRDLKPDLVHTHSSKAGILGRWAAKNAGVPVIIHTIHGLAFTASQSPLVNTAYRLLERATAPITTRIVCVADAMRDQSLAAGVGRPAQYTTIYSGMTTEPFVHADRTRDAVRRELGLQPDHLVIGTIARLFDLKGHEDLLASAPALCAAFPQVRFLWVGDGTLRPAFERTMNHLGLRDRFVLTGMVPPSQVPRYVGAMDVLVHPSRREGLARALPQGALAGKPVVAYDIDGNREAVLQDASGFVIPPFDVDALMQALQRLLADATLRRRFGDAGRVFALQRFGAPAMVDALQSLYASLLGDGSMTE